MKFSWIGVIVAVGGAYLLREHIFPAVMSRAARSDSDCVALVGYTTTEEDGHQYVTGSVRNDCGQFVNSVTVVFRENPPGANPDWPQASAQAYIGRLKPGETKDFKSALPMPPDATISFDRLTAF
jgi:hypothetical protein